MILQGNSYRIPLKDNSVHCAISSFPYFGLRDYGLPETVWGGRSDCQHVWITERTARPNSSGGPSAKQDSNHGSRVSDYYDRATYSQFCQLCGAWLGCFGLEPTIALHVQNAVAVCREIKRVLRPDGIFFLNYGDSYATSRNGRSAADTKAVGKDDRTFRDKPFSITELPAKNLCGIPWRVALALQDDGWILRSDIIWSKKNPMPESVEDRPTRAHEYIFMLTKEPRYFYDQDAVREGLGEWSRNALVSNWARKIKNTPPGQNPQGFVPERNAGNGYGDSINPAGRNRRTVWELSTEPFPGAHFATFPTKLVEPMILAATSARGCCPKCGKGWERIVEKTVSLESGSGKAGNKPNGKYAGMAQSESGDYDIRMGPVITAQTTGWCPGCNCGIDETVPTVILDPFCGSGTVGEVCRQLGRRFVGIDLSAEYLAKNALPRAEGKTSQAAIGQLPLFAQLESA